MSIRVKVIKNKFPRIPQVLRGNVVNMLNRTAHETVDIVRQLAPVETGNLKGSVEVLREARGNNLRSTIGVGADYGIYVEYGTARQEAQPFFTPAIENMRPVFKQRRKAVLDEATKLIESGAAK